MRYSDPELIDILAAEYVSGTLIGGARSRFESLMKYRVDVRNSVDAWEEKLMSLAAYAEQQKVPKSIWRNIEQEINGNLKPKSKSIFAWPTFASTAALAASLAVLVLVYTPQQSVNNLEVVGVKNHIGLVGEQAAPMWVITADLKSGSLVAKAINSPAIEMDQAFELWMLPSEGNPRSIGLLPTGAGYVKLDLPESLSALLYESKGLAVSVEPAGGSPTGLPTGAVIQTTKIWEL